MDRTLLRCHHRTLNRTERTTNCGARVPLPEEVRRRRNKNRLPSRHRPQTYIISRTALTPACEHCLPVSLSFCTPSLLSVHLFLVILLRTLPTTDPCRAMRSQPCSNQMHTGLMPGKFKHLGNSLAQKPNKPSLKWSPIHTCSVHHRSKLRPSPNPVLISERPPGRHAN